MKYIKYITLSLSLLFVSCKSDDASIDQDLKRAEDIKEEGLKSDCDCVEGLDILLQDILSFIEDKSDKELGANKDLLQKKVNNFEKIGLYCGENYGFDALNLDKINDCGAVNDFKKTMKEADQNASRVKKWLEPAPITHM